MKVGACDGTKVGVGWHESGCGRENKKKKPAPQAPQAPSGAAGRLRVLWGTVGERYKGYYNLRIMYASHF